MAKEKENTGVSSSKNTSYPPYLFNVKAYEEFKTSVAIYTKQQQNNNEPKTQNKDSKKSK